MKWRRNILFICIYIIVMSGCSWWDKKSQSGSPAPANPPQHASNWLLQKPLAFTISLPTTKSGGYSSKVDLQHEKWLDKLYDHFGVRMHVQVTEQDKLPLLFASGQIPDVVGVYGTPSTPAMSGSVEAGVFHPLSQLLKTHTPKLMELIPEAAWKAVSMNGEIFGVPSYLSNPSRRATYIRKDLLQQTGLSPPQTVEEFVAMLRAFKKLGVAAPYAMRENFKYADLVFGAYDVLPYKDQFTVIGDEVVPKFFKIEAMQQALRTMKTMYDEGLIARDFATITASHFFKTINSGEAAMWSHNAISLNTFATTIQQAVPDASVGIIPSPKGPKHTGGYLLYTPVLTSYYVNNKVEPERVIAILKFLEWQATSREASMFYTFGIEGETYSVDRDGSIDYYGAPVTLEEQDEEVWRSGTLWLITDSAINRDKIATMKYGQEIIHAMDHTLRKEGLGGIGFYPELPAFMKYPTLAPQQDVGPSFIVDNMVQMIYGVRPIEEWPEVLEEYRDRGGDEIIAEATERYFNNDGVIELTR
ncbi:extracellular solute-binding protein [Paenibacillus sp. J5C_2022]|uniref:extracellular solute-binding protein n=1 Tax=Paenibacillus sp. J5C2022 TaxID=2977129 RepID=UPI0021D090B9|nr:extracellular solute-binding protein [Paenibacillus sp. J5C2022]MCU6707524.1 extracellular solute-binding protein [Paenibacillus sp. J5C2022]